MRFLTKLLCMMLLAGFMASTPQFSQAQILKRIKKAVEQKVEDKAVEEASEAIDEAVDDAADQAGEAAQGEAEKAVQESAGGAGRFNGVASDAPGGTSTDGLTDFRELKNVFPEEVLGVKRTTLNGGKAGAFGFKTSSAEGSYGDDNGLEVTVTDMGTTSGIAALAFAWVNVEVDNETETGFERTTKFKEWPSLEKQDKNGSNLSSEVQVVIGNRFLIDAKSNVLGVNQVKQALEKFDLAKLASIAQAQGTFEPVDYQQLKALLPASISGLNRTEAAGEQSAAFGLKTSNARAEFNDGKIGTVTIEITDSGNIGFGSAQVLTGPWSQALDKTSDKGFERTTKYNGYAAYERYTKEKDIPANYKADPGMAETFNSSDIEIAVGKRFVVKVTGTNVPFETVKAAAQQVDLQKLEALAK